MKSGFKIALVFAGAVQLGTGMASYFKGDANNARYLVQTAILCFIWAEVWK